MSSWQYFEPIATLFQKNVAIGLTFCNSERKYCNALFFGNTVPLLPPFWTNVAKHTPITTQFAVMQMALSGNRVEI